MSTTEINGYHVETFMPNGEKGQRYIVTKLQAANSIAANCPVAVILRVDYDPAGERDPDITTLSVWRDGEVSWSPEMDC